MVYREFQPHPFWQSYIASYWFASGEVNGTSRVYPDGYVDLIFHGTSSETPRVSGMMTHYRDVVFNRRIDLVGIRFKPSGLSLLEGLPMSDLKNISSCLSEISTWPIEKWNQKLWAIPWLEDKIHWIEHHLLPELFHGRKKVDQLITAVCKEIDSRYTEVDIGALARQYYLSLRQLERRFKGAVGVNMKEYHRIVRFTNALSDIEGKPQRSLLQIAYDHGFSDHAHLTREVLRMTGKNPSDLRQVL